MTVLALITAVVWVVLGTYTAWGWLRFANLRKETASPAKRTLPSLSVVVPARNEAEAVRETIERLGASDYPGLEIVLVNDRSDDGTGDIAESLRPSISNLRVLHVRELPERWLGKTHAMWFGANASSGEWLCFVDGDVHLAPDCLRRAMHYALNHDLHYLTLFPRMKSEGLWSRAFVIAFGFLFGLGFQPWRAKDPKSSRYCGVGAFQLIRRSSYHAVGTHERLRLEVIDDVKFGKIVKRANLKVDAIGGDDLLTVEWQRGGLWNHVRGMEKNGFAGFDYRVSGVIVSSIALVILDVLPFVTVFLLEGPGRWASLVSLMCFTVAYAVLAQQMKLSPLYVLTHPVAAILIIVTNVRSMWLTLSRGGIEWRGTFYPLDVLRKHLV